MMMTYPSCILTTTTSYYDKEPCQATQYPHPLRPWQTISSKPSDVRNLNDPGSYSSRGLMSGESTPPPCQSIFPDRFVTMGSDHCSGDVAGVSWCGKNGADDHWTVQRSVRNLHGEAWAKAHFVERWRTQEMARSDGVTIAIHDAVESEFQVSYLRVCLSFCLLYHLDVDISWDGKFASRIVCSSPSKSCKRGNYHRFMSQSEHGFNSNVNFHTDVIDPPDVELGTGVGSST